MSKIKPHILWVCEQPSRAWRLALPQQGIEYQLCQYAEQAISMAEHLGPTVILQSMHMSACHGSDLLRRYKKHPILNDIPVIMISDDAKPVRQHAFLAQANDCVTSDTSAYELAMRIRQQSIYYMQSLEQQSLSKQLEKVELQLSQCQQQYQQATHQDALTGLANRQYFTRIYKREWSRALRETEALSVIIADIDCFKTYNDRYGHAKGDECIQHIADLIHQSLQRPTDFCARYSGEEFIIVLPGTPAQGAIQVAERIRKGLITLNIEHQDSSVASCITLSLGLATTSPMLKHRPRDLLRTADIARYEAKKQGRNRLICKSL